MFSPGVGEISIQPEQTMFSPDAAKIDFSYKLDDAGKTASDMANAAGVPKADPIVPPVKPQDKSVDTQITDAVSKAVESIGNLATERKQIVEGKPKYEKPLFEGEQYMFVGDSITSINKRINDIIKETDPTELQKQLMTEFSKARPVQKVATARDFFIEVDKNRKEKLTKRGEATLVISLLANLFGAPGQGAQTSAMATGIGERFAKEQNVINEAQFKQEVDTFNQKIQGLQAQLGFQAQKRETLISAEKVKLDQLKTRLEQNTELSKTEIGNLTKVLTDAKKAETSGLNSEKNQMLATAKVYYMSPDINYRKAGYNIYKMYGINMPEPADYTKYEEKFDGELAVTEAKKNKLVTDNEIAQIKRDMEKQKLPYTKQLMEANIALLLARKAQALRPPSRGGASGQPTYEQKQGFAKASAAVTDASKRKAAAQEQLIQIDGEKERIYADPNLSEEDKAAALAEVNADYNTQFALWTSADAELQIQQQVANSYLGKAIPRDYAPSTGKVVVNGQEFAKDKIKNDKRTQDVMKKSNTPPTIFERIFGKNPFGAG
jgi:hypothetical protein